MVSSTPRPHFTPGKDPVPILLEGGWVGSRAGLDGRKISSPPGFDRGPSSPQSGTIPTDPLKGNNNNNELQKICQI